MAKRAASKQRGNGIIHGVQQELKTLLDGGQAHVSFDDAVKGFPPRLRGTVVEELPYSAWQIVEHIRMAQRDILDYCRNHDGSYKPMKWPEDYWPKDAAPPNGTAWGESLKAIKADRRSLEALLKESDSEGLAAPFPWGQGQTLLREILLVADHSAYHTGELVVLRRLLGCWKT